MGVTFGFNDIQDGISDWGDEQLSFIVGNASGKMLNHVWNEGAPFYQNTQTLQIREQTVLSLYSDGNLFAFTYSSFWNPPTLGLYVQEAPQNVPGDYMGVLTLRNPNSVLLITENDQGLYNILTIESDYSQHLIASYLTLNSSASQGSNLISSLSLNVLDMVISEKPIVIASQRVALVSIYK